MSSVTSSFAQKAGRTKNLITLSAPTQVLDVSNNELKNAFTFTNDKVNPSIPLSSVALSTFRTYKVTQYSTLATGQLLRDTGRQIVVFDDITVTPDGLSPTTDIYRECVVVNGDLDEGIGSTVNLFVKVFSDVTPTIYFARSG